MAFFNFQYYLSFKNNNSDIPKMLVALKKELDNKNIESYFNGNFPHYDPERFPVKDTVCFIEKEVREPFDVETFAAQFPNIRFFLQIDCDYWSSCNEVFSSIRTINDASQPFVEDNIDLGEYEQNDEEDGSENGWNAYDDICQQNARKRISWLNS